MLRRMLPLTAGHAAVDFSQGALPALLPLFTSRFALSYAAAGALLFAMTAASSVTQPLFGLVADRIGLVWMLPVAVAASGVGLALATRASSYALCLVAIVAAGLGVAAYHPEGARMAHHLAETRPAASMALFSVGGNIGVAAGAAAVAGLVRARAGLHAGPLLAIPAVLVGAVLVAYAPRLSRSSRANTHRTLVGPDRPRALALLLGGVTIRGYVYYGLIGFVPLYEVHERHRSAAHGALVLTALLVAGAVGTILLGRVADRIGLRRCMTTALLVVAPLVTLYLETASLIGQIAVVLAGAALISTFALSVVLAQAYLPSRASTAAGLAFGLSIGAGGMLAVLLGRIADAYGLGAALATCIPAAVFAAAACFAMPDETRLRPR